jgi:phosphoglycolate phosphatase
MRKTIIFDFDGTIADTFPIVINIVHEIVKRYGMVVTTEEGRAAGLKQTLKKLKFPTLKIPQVLFEIKHRLRLKIKEEVDLFNEMDMVLNNLSQKYDLGIISSNSESNIKSFLDKHHLLSLFNYIHTDSSLFGKHIILKKFCRKFKIKYSDVIYIGDEDRDIVAAKKMKIKVIAVTWGYNDKSLLEKEKPDYLVEEPKQILDICN